MIERAGKKRRGFDDPHRRLAARFKVLAAVEAIVQAVVPAAGEGTRLRPLTATRPKGLIEVGRRPILTHVFETLRDANVDRIVVIVGHLRDQIEEYYGTKFRGTPVTFVEQAERLGLAHAVQQASSSVRDSFILLNGDNVFAESIGDVLTRLGEPGVDGVLLVERASREKARTRGVVRHTAGRVRGIVEKPDEPPSRLITTGCYALPSEIFGACERISPSDRGEYELGDAVNQLITEGFEFVAIPFEGWRANINTPTDLAIARARLAREEIAWR